MLLKTPVTFLILWDELWFKCDLALVYTYTDTDNIFTTDEPDFICHSEKLNIKKIVMQFECSEEFWLKMTAKKNNQNWTFYWKLIEWLLHLFRYDTRIYTLTLNQWLSWQVLNRQPIKNLYSIILFSSFNLKIHPLSDLN